MPQTSMKVLDQSEGGMVTKGKLFEFRRFS